MFTKDIGIDLGTANTLVYMKGRGIIMREPSVVAVDPRSDELRVRSVGHEAKAVIGRAPGSIVAVRPLKDGVIAEKPMFFFLERYMMAYANEVNQFVEAIVNDTPTPVNANDGLQPVLIGLAAKKSVEEHRPVKIAEIRAQYGL